MRVGEQFCPGILHAVQAKDGLLLRIRVPGGLIEAEQLRVVADLSRSLGDGQVEITSRANLQLRGIQSQDLTRIVASIAGAGLLPSPQHDRVRNIVTSPIAGFDREELIDTRPLVRELDMRLRENAIFADLHPKFSFAVFGGPKRFSYDLDDLTLEVVDFNSESYFHLRMAEVPLGRVIKRADAVTCMLTAAHMCVEMALEFNTRVRANAILRVPGARERIVNALSHVSTRLPALPPPSFVRDALIGICPTAEENRVNIIPSVPLGRLTAQQACTLVNVANERKSELRFAPWRGVVLCSVPKGAAKAIADQLRFVGLSCEGRDGLQGIAACAGMTGCNAALADVRADAVSLAQRFAGHTAPSGWTVNLSGCEKQCGRRHGASAELVADVSGYTLNIDGRCAATGCSTDVALDAIAARHETLLCEVAAQ